MSITNNVKARLKMASKTEAEWISSNPIGLAGEWMVTSDASPIKIKIGDGTNVWSELPYKEFATSYNPKIYTVSIPSTSWVWDSDASTGTVSVDLADCAADWNPIVYLDTSSATASTLSDMLSCFNGIVECVTSAGSILFTTVVEPTVDLSIYLYVSDATLVEG